ncbi:MAG: FadR family transcriptional regulator, partial [Rubrivivax sp.]|nr:FadR family transcriptional regulator [Pyrinomonadaceae bacterium]
MTDSKGETFKAADPSHPVTTSEEVISHLREMIHRGELRPGDRLPPERDLAKLLGISRPTLRAGIRSLAAVGVLQARQGAGTFVVKSDGPPSLDSSPLRMMASLHGFTPGEMFEARQSLEMAVAGLAADRATGDQMASMSEEIVGMYASLDDPEQFLVHDMRFHQTVAAASGNRILTSL